MKKAEFKVLVDNDKHYPLAKRSAAVVLALRELQVTSAYYSDVERYSLAKQYKFAGVIENEKEEDGSIKFDIQEPELGAAEFYTAVAKLLFPSAQISEENAGSIDLEQVEEGLQAFLNFIEPRRHRQIDLQALLSASRASQTANIGAETPMVVR